jgi:two-component system, NarL family, response regulator YdfI
MSDIRILLGTSSEIRGAGLVALLAERSHIQIIDRVSIDEAVRRSENMPVDIILLDFDNGDENHILALLQDRPKRDARLVLLTDESIDMGSDLFNEAGIRAILPRQPSGDQLIQTIEAVQAGLFVFHPDLFQADDFTLFNRSTSIGDTPGMTPRESEVLELLSQGWTNKEIAEQLGISDHTIKFHITSIFEKLNVSSRTEAVMTGIRLGLIMI